MGDILVLTEPDLRKAVHLDLASVAGDRKHAIGQIHNDIVHGVYVRAILGARQEGPFRDDDPVVLEHFFSARLHL